MIQVEVPNDDYWRRQVKCQDACPVHTDARGYVRAIAAGNLEQAYLIARAPNPLASICGRVCGAPCEAACRRGDIDQPIAIRALKRFVTERFGAESGRFRPLQLLERVLRGGADRLCRGQEDLAGLRSLLRDLETPPADGLPVAIIGSGPAGLAAAHDLALLGCRPVVFEMEPVPAGMLAVGIPAYRLPRKLIQAEIEIIRALGVRFECGVCVGKDITLEQIRQRFSRHDHCGGRQAIKMSGHPWRRRTRRARRCRVSPGCGAIASNRTGPACGGDRWWQRRLRRVTIGDPPSGHGCVADCVTSIARRSGQLGVAGEPGGTAR